MRRRIFALWAVLGVVLHAAIAWGAPKDAQALKLDEDAINVDYLAMKFGDAEKKLKQAIALCAKGACSPNVLAQVHRDLGIVYVVSSKKDQGKASFADALKADPAVTIPKELATPEIEQVFASAKGGPPPAPTPTPAPEKPAPKAPPAPSAPTGGGSDELAHSPPAESAILTPLPLYAEAGEGISPVKVQVKYKPFGAPEWKTIEMKKMKTGYGAEVSCIEIGTLAGELKYYIQAVGSGGEVVATAGTKNAPLKVIVKEQIEGDAPHLPGKPAPQKCSGPGASDCPPEFPGCKQSKKGVGFTCEADNECQSGQCKGGTCFSDDAPEAKCDSDTGCEAGQWCNAGFCASPKKNWIGAAIQQDALYLPSAKDICWSGEEYTCFDADGIYFGGEGSPDGLSGEVAGGFAIGTTRVILAYDRVMSDNLTLGGRIGYAFGGAPTNPVSGKSFLPVHVEARATYWFGTDPFITLGLRPYGVGGLGIAQYDGKVEVKVHQKMEAPNSEGLPYNAWRQINPVFATAGFGLLYALDRGSGISFELRGVAAFPITGLGAALQVGYAMGLF